MPVPATHQDPRTGAGWAICDPVTGLRFAGRGTVVPLAGDGPIVLGSAAECEVRLSDPSGRVSRRHAELVRDAVRDVWTLHDARSTNGVRVDGELRQVAQLAAGVEVELGGVTLVAESARLAELRARLAIVLGFGAARAPEIDRAVQQVRAAAIARTGLLLVGDGDLVGIARRLHALAVGDHPFVVCGDGDRLPALADLGAGTLCLVGRHPPGELAALAEALRDTPLARTISCTAPSAGVTDVPALLAAAHAISIPALAARVDERPRIIEAYAADAARALGAPSIGFREHEHAWLSGLPLRTLAEIEELATRLVALRTWGVAGGAARLGITHGALSTWASRRRIPT